jgi:hypothetical protein
MTSPMDKALLELKWLQDNPAFEERPASIDEFLGDGYLNIASGIRGGVRAALIDIFGEESNGRSIARVQRAIFTGAIGIGKTTLASIALPYMCHWVLCLRDPQAFFDLLPGSRIAFMQMSTSKDQAKEVLFGDIFARIKYSTWFSKYPHDPAFKNQVRFPKDVWIIPGDSAETTFEGYNILGGILDEIDSHRVTPKKDYAQSGYDTIHSRITSRFGDQGLLILIGQMKKSHGFAANKLKEYIVDPKASVARMAIWESFGWDKYESNPDGSRKSFFYNVRRRLVVPRAVAISGLLDTGGMIEVPCVYQKDFENDPTKAARDLAGIPPIVGSTYIGMVERITLARDKWKQRYGLASPLRPSVTDLLFEDWFRAPNTLPRALHLDIAYSDEGDALGIAMGHVPEVKEIDGEDRPVIVFDLIVRLRPLPGQQIILGDVRQLIYTIRDDMGFRIKKITMDGFQSTDMMQQLNKKRFTAGWLSVDKNKIPYQDLRDAIYEQRIEWPEYRVPLRHGDTETVEIAVRELEQLIDIGTKVDHPEGGSKDVADAMAGVVFTLMGDRKYRRGVLSPSANTQPPALDSSVRRRSSVMVGSLDLRLPIPPSLIGAPPNIPNRLRPGDGRYR